MFKFILPIYVAASVFGLAARAEVPKVVVDIAPIYGIVSQVMDGVGTPSLVVEQAASPHDFSMRPSHARGLQNADVVFAVSPELTPWLVGSLQTLAKDADVIFLADTNGTVLLETREDEGHHHEGGHDHGDIDPHSWLDPNNAVMWSHEIARILAQSDPQNSETYQENAAAFDLRMQAMSQAIQDEISDVGSSDYFVNHDAFQYFENRFGVPSLGAITNTEAVRPGPRKLQEVREQIKAANVKCLAVEPGFQQGLLDAIAPNGGVNVAVMDPLGATLPLDANLYEATLSDMAHALAACLRP